MNMTPKVPIRSRRWSMACMTSLVLAALVISPMESQGRRKSVQVRRMDVEPLSPQKIDRLGDKTRLYYQKALGSMDRINYPLALGFLDRAVQSAPDDVYLRFNLVRLAHYLGDTRVGSDSIQYYDITEENLRELEKAPQLNEREKRRTREAIALVVELRRAVAERDEKRKKNGRELADELREEIYRDLEPEGEEESLKGKREKQLRQMSQEVQRSSGRGGGGGGGGGGAGSMGAPMMGGGGGSGGGGGGGGAFR